MKVKTLVWICVLLAVAVGVLQTFRSDPETPEVRKAQTSRRLNRLTRRRATTVEQIKLERDRKAKGRPKRESEKVRHYSNRPDEVSEQDRAVFDQIDVALNEGDFSQILKLTDELRTSTNEISRLRAVEALGWFEDAALPELTPFLMDEDEGVRFSAQDQWSAAFDQISDEKFKVSVLEATMNAIKDPNLLEDLAFHFGEMPTFTAIESLVSLIEGADGNPEAAAVALESYSFLTGQDYTTLADAQAWVDANVEEEEDEDMPVYRASKHPEFFDERLTKEDFSGVKVVNDTDYEIPAFSKEKEAASGDGSAEEGESSPQSDQEERVSE